MPREDRVFDTTAAVRPKARGSVHKELLDWFAEREPGRLLDAPAGFGHMGMKLKELGFSVTCGEIEPEIFAVPDMDCIYTDLNRRIDAEDASFDYTICVDGLEHMTDPYQAVAEFARVLKDGGYAVFSLPNYSNIERRMQFVFRGFFTRPIANEKFEEENRTLFNFHNSILTITVLEFMFRINNLELVEIRKNAPKRKQVLFAPLVWLLHLINAFRSERKRRQYRSDLTLHPNVVLGGNNLILITRKASGNSQGEGGSESRR